jgi:hypothetical protein
VSRLLLDLAPIPLLAMFSADNFHDGDYVWAVAWAVAWGFYAALVLADTLDRRGGDA